MTKIKVGGTTVEVDPEALAEFLANQKNALDPEAQKTREIYWMRDDPLDWTRVHSPYSRYSGFEPLTAAKEGESNG